MKKRRLVPNLKGEKPEQQLFYRRLPCAGIHRPADLPAIKTTPRRMITLLTGSMVFWTEVLNRGDRAFMQHRRCLLCLTFESTENLDFKVYIS